MLRPLVSVILPFWSAAGSLVAALAAVGAAAAVGSAAAVGAAAAAVGSGAAGGAAAAVGAAAVGAAGALAAGVPPQATRIGSIRASSRASAPLRRQEMRANRMMFSFRNQRNLLMNCAHSSKIL